MPAPLVLRLRAAFAIPLLLANPAAAQTMRPVLGQTFSATDSFSLQVRAMNPHSYRIAVRMQAYDQEFRPIEALVYPSSFVLGAGGNRVVRILVPFDGADQRKVRVCTESDINQSPNVTMRFRICGRFLGTRMR